MKKSKTGFLIGRFQPFHKGHLYLLKESLKAVDELVIGIGSPDGGSQAENPFSFARRKKMLEIVIHEKHLSQRVQKITPVYDYLESDDQWYEEAKKAGGSFTVIIGNNEWTNGIFEKQGYPVIRFPFFKRFLYEGVKIRRLMREGKNWQSRVPESIVGVIKTDYRHAVLGGTFDHFHKGHVRLLSEAFQQANKVSIGVTAASMNSQKKLAGTIEPYDLRFKSVQAFLRSKNWQERAAVFPITDIFGPTKTDPSLDAIVVSPDTRQSALTINDFRKKNGRSVLEIISVPLEKGTDGQVIT
ncbi:pantetheine-phosphate adenylyltransferase, partial [Candidatus Roizmanbacteria bacterium]|nr:pantetheine-phosphate adenylyltransferase [Candidatus Roizmanbacteria bacterium]